MKAFAAAAALTLFLFLACPPASAQREEYVEQELPQLMMVAHADVGLRTSPSTASAPRRVVNAGETLHPLSIVRTNGFYHVRTAAGGQGWVWSGSVSVIEAPALAAPPLAAPTLDTLAKSTAARVRPNCPTPTECNAEENGCARDDPTSPQAVLNRTKRRAPTTARARLLTFADFRTLQTATNRLFENRQPVPLEQEDRDHLRGLRLRGGAVSEGQRVRVTGFLVGDPHPNDSGESVNCQQTGSAANDYHIPVAPDFDGEPETPQNEFRGIVVEMIPQEGRRRDGSWTTAKLTSALKARRAVLVEGALFFDNEHKVRVTDDRSLHGQPRRFSLWEVHPVTDFYVCMRENNRCDPRRLGEWTRLEEYQVERHR
jgi:hypothetical protein